VKAQLQLRDNQYYVMPNVGDWAKITFSVPTQEKGTSRSIFLKTTGYYELHLAKDRAEQTDFIERLMTTPGLVTEIAMKEYLIWRATQRATK